MWWIQYFDADGKRRREKVGRKSDAIDLRHSRKADALVGKKMPENLRQKAVSFSELAADAIEHAKAHKRTHEDDVIRLKPLESAFGTRAAESIKPQEIDRWLNAEGQERNWKPATYNRYRALISMIYREGIKNSRVKDNPARRVQKRKENNTVVRFLSAEEEAKLRGQIALKYPHRLPEFDIALHTGMRRGEQYGCEWSTVDLDRAIVTIPRAKHGDTRHVFLNETAIAAFRTVRQFASDSAFVFGHAYRRKDTKGAREWFAKCVADAGIKKLRWHDLRHTFASRLVMRGVDIRTVQELMGHKTIQITLRYAHLAPQHQLAAVQRLCDTECVLDEPSATKTATGHEATFQ
jgi:site-specific recombinase XerD